jgi:hypothetical protein
MFEMPRVRTICTALLLAAALGGSAAASASAAKLTLYAGGQPLMPGTRESSTRIAFTGASPMTITVPGAGLTTVCTPTKEWFMRGYVVSNEKRTDEVQLIEERGLNEDRRCTGNVAVAGPQFGGTLELKANGTARMFATAPQQQMLYVLVGACIYRALSLPVEETVTGPLAISFDVTLRSREPSCSPDATLEMGPFQATFISFQGAFEPELVEGLVGWRLGAPPS